MRRLLSNTAGGPETLVVEDGPAPVPGPGEVVVEMRACALNFPDLLMIEDLYQVRPPRPFSPGSEFAGVIRGVGAQVTDLAPGDRVIGLTGWGGMAEQVLLPADACIPMPDCMPFEDGASLLVTYATSLFALQEGALRPGETMLVLGAAGGIGLAAVELGRHLGARVVAAVSSEEKAAVAKAHGADEAILYPRGPLDRDGQRALGTAIKAACGEGGPDVVCDPVGGDYAEPAFRSLAFDGRYLVLGFTAGIPSLPLNLPLLKSGRVLGISFGASAARDPALRNRVISQTMDLYAQGVIRPAISQLYPLKHASEAFAAMAARRSHGKLLIINEQ